MSTEKFYPSARLELITIVEERLGERRNDTNSFFVSDNKIKELITQFKDENRKKNKKEI